MADLWQCGNLLWLMEALHIIVIIGATVSQILMYSSVWCVGHCWAPGRRSVDQGSSVGSAAWVSEVFSKWHRAQGETGEDNFSSSGDGTISASGWSLEGISLPSPRAVGEY